MATSIEHYLEAERLLQEAADAHDAGDDECYLLDAARVHATLAAAAVTALNLRFDGLPREDYRAWFEAASTEAPIPTEREGCAPESESTEGVATPIGPGSRVEVLYPPRGRRETTAATLYKGCEGIVTTIAPRNCWFVRLDRVPVEAPDWVGKKVSFREDELRVVADVALPKGATQGLGTYTLDEAMAHPGGIDALTGGAVRHAGFSVEGDEDDEEPED